MCGQKKRSIEEEIYAPLFGAVWSWWCGFFLLFLLILFLHTFIKAAEHGQVLKVDGIVINRRPLCMSVDPDTFDAISIFVVQFLDTLL